MMAPAAVPVSVRSPVWPIRDDACDRRHAGSLARSGRGAEPRMLRGCMARFGTDDYCALWRGLWRLARAAVTGLPRPRRPCAAGSDRLLGAPDGLDLS